MAHVTIRIDTDNAAFDDDFEAEISRILRALIARIEYGSMGEYIPIYDLNGNKVGEFNHTQD